MKTFLTNFYTGSVCLIVSFLIVIGAAGAALYTRQLDARLPDAFCKGERFDGQRYEDFIMSEDQRISLSYRCKWMAVILRLQNTQCVNGMTFEKPDVCLELTR